MRQKMGGGHRVWVLINYLALLTAFYALKCFASEVRDSEILLRIDNTTAVTSINKTCSCKHKNLNTVSARIWKWCEVRNIRIFASYSDYDSEYSLYNHAFNIILNRLGIPNIDLFASSINTKCKTFVSWKRDPESIAVDVFTLNWSELDFYAFPPFSLISKVLSKIISDKARGILVIPI